MKSRISQRRKDNKDVILLKENHFINTEIRLNEESKELLDLHHEISKIHQQYYDKQVKQGIRKKDPDFKKDKLNGYWQWKGQIYVPIIVLQSLVLSGLSALEGKTEDRTEDCEYKTA
jgi:hypothetical protein